MTVSMRLMSAGDGYRYLLKTVAAGDGERDLSTPLTRYYAETGTPPGQWVGQGVTGLGGGTLRSGDQVSERHLELLIGQGRDPVTGVPLGRPYPKYLSVTERVTQRVEALSETLTPAERDAQVALIEAEEVSRPVRRPVAGFDYTFSVPKSVSTLWAVSDAGTQALIYQAHRDAIAQVLDLMERQVAATRTGASSRDGSIVQADVTGLVATAFDHYDSRAGDPHLHTHVVIANRVQAVHDGRWRTLDSRPMHAAVVALSEYHQAVLADKMTILFGVGWDTRQRGQHRNPSWDVENVPETLIQEFSSRAESIDTEAQRLVGEYTSRHGRAPSKATILKLRQQATLTTRPGKQIHSLAELTAQWRQRASGTLGEDATRWAQHILDNPRQPVLRADDIPLDVIADLASSVVDTVGEKRATWRRWNLWSETARQTMGWRFATTNDREQFTSLICDQAEHLSVRLTPADIPVPAEFTRPDGTTRLRPRHSTVYTSQALIDAEDRLLTLSHRLGSPTLDPDTVQNTIDQPHGQDVMLSDDQAAALLAIATSGRVLDVLVGPAGAGKTTALAALRSSWEQEHGPGSVVGLAPSAVGAQVLGDELGILTENTAKWLWDHNHTGSSFTAGQLVIVDEASLAGTFTLDQIASLAADAGAKMLLVGDWAQLGAVEAGGAFNLLAHDREDTPELTDIHRFSNQWEKLASLKLRHAQPDVIDEYEQHGRISGGSQDQMLEAAYQAWHADLDCRRSTILIADNHQTVDDLNQRARQDRIQTGRVDPVRPVTLAGGIQASKGDVVITRCNDRRLVAGRTGWVRNGDRWIITKTLDDGSVTIRRAGYRFGASIVLPTFYVAEHLDLGYAVTAHRAQGVTTDTSHILVTEATTRENLYVGLTRGRQHNHAWVATDQPDDLQHTSNKATTARDVLETVLRNVGTEQSAHQVAQDEHEKWNRIDHLVAMHQEIYKAAIADRWASLIQHAGLTDQQAQQVQASDAYGPLCHELARMDSTRRSPEQALPLIVSSRPLDDVQDIAAVLYRRVEAVNNNPDTQRCQQTRQSYVLGLVPQATGPIRDDMKTSLTQIEIALRQRSRELAQQAVHDHEPWLTALGPRPIDTQTASQWNQTLEAVAAYRERWGIGSATPLGASSGDPDQQADAVRVRCVVTAARQAADTTAQGGMRQSAQQAHLAL